MAEASYTLVFQGDILAGFEREQVMQRFGQLFRVSAEDVDKIFGHPRVVLKRNLDRAAAEHISQVADGNLDAFAAAQREQLSAAGGEIGDLFDVDLSI